jgi:methyltransferase (TIGR00027 family)
MENSTVLRTAPLLTYFRAYHAAHDAPKIFDDFLAYSLLTEQEREFFDRQFATAVRIIDPEHAASCPDKETALAWFMRAIAPLSLAISRARYAEELLIKAVREGVRQYVILGAGMDTFAFRCPELVKHLRVYELDHPSAQACKRGRIDEAGLEKPEQLHFVPVDFTRENPAAALARSPFDPGQPSFFSCLGVTYYLGRRAVLGAFRGIGCIALPGSRIVFDYLDNDAFVPERTAMRVQVGKEYMRNSGKPMITGFDPSSLASELARLGLRLEENLSPTDIEERYFRGRTDGYHAYEHAHFAQAVVGKYRTRKLKKLTINKYSG